MKYFAIFSLLISTIYGQVTQAPNCRFEADIILVLDSSGSVGSGNFQMIRNAMVSLVAAFDVGTPADNEKIRVGVVNFASNIITVAALAGYANEAQLQGLISSSVSNPFQAGLTNIVGALDRARDLLISGTGANNPGSRQNTSDASLQRVIFIVGDGIPTTGGDANAVNARATALKNGSAAGLPFPVEIFSIFIGTSTSGMTLFENISSGLPQWFINFANFGAFDPSTVIIQFCRTVGGDVHFETHDGVMYTFNGAGDYVYMRSDKIEMHVRDVYVGRATALAALAISDKDTGSVLELWWDGDSSESLNINIRHKGKGNQVVSFDNKNAKHNPFHLYKLDGRVQIRHENYSSFSVVAQYGGRASFSVQVPKEWKTTGLGGNNNGLPEDDICNRSGKCVSLNATNREVHEIGLDWAVLPSELLFEKWMPIQDWEIRYHPLQVSAEQLVMAKKVCGDVQPCIYDYISTGSEEYAKHTKNDFYSLILNEGKLVYVGDRY